MWKCGRKYENIISLDFNLKKLYKDGKYPRVYQRRLGCDSILELEQFYDLNKQPLATVVFIKSKKQCVYVSLGDENLNLLKLPYSKEFIDSIARNHTRIIPNLAATDYDVTLFSLGYPKERGYLIFDNIKQENRVFLAERKLEIVKYEVNEHDNPSMFIGFEGFIERRVRKNKFSKDNILYESEIDKQPIVLSDKTTIFNI